MDCIKMNIPSDQCVILYLQCDIDHEVDAKICKIIGDKMTYRIFLNIPDKI